MTRSPKTSPVNCSSSRLDKARGGPPIGGGNLVESDSSLPANRPRSIGQLSAKDQAVQPQVASVGGTSDL